MATKIVAAIILLLVNVTAGVIFLAGLVIAMNGYSESDALWGLIGFVVLAIFVTALTVAGAIVLVSVLTKKQFRAAASVSIGVSISSIVAVVLQFVSSLISVGVAEIVRVKF